MEILHSKLLPPKIGDTVSRKSDSPLRDELKKKRITLVTAGAGYGKTTFIAQATAAFDTVWYRIAETERDFYVFLNYLAAGIGAYYPRFGEDIREYFQDEELFRKDKRAVLTYFLHAMETIIDREIVIVLDDFHAVHDSREILDCIQFLVENLPQEVRIVIISRTRVDLALSRLRLMGEVAEVSEKELAFSPGDIYRLFEGIFGMRLAGDAIEKIHAWSQGWAAGLILFYHAAKGRDQSGIDGILQKMQGSERGISEYLNENVFMPLTEEVRSFLLKTSMLPRLNSSMCDRFLDIRNSGEILKRLEKDHLFTFSLDASGREYTYHHLFQDFLTTKMAGELEEAERRVLYGKAARLFEEQDMSEEAISHYLKAGEFIEASRVLAAAGQRMLSEGQMSLVSSFLDRMPQELASVDPWLIYIRAYHDSILGRNRDAIEGFQKARVLFEEQGLQHGMDLSEYNLGAMNLVMGYFVKAEEHYTKILGNPSSDPMVSALLIPDLIFINAFLGRIETSDRYYEAGLSVVSGITDAVQNGEYKVWLSINRCIRFNITGDFQHAIACMEQVQQSVQKSRNYRLISLYYAHFAMSCSYAGQYSRGFEKAATALKIVREKGFRDFMLGWSLMANCMSCVGLKSIPEALDYGMQALKCFQETGSPWGEASVCVALQMIHMKTGNIDAADDMIRHGLKLLDATDFPQIKLQLLAALAALRTIQGNIPESESLLAEVYRQNPSSKTFPWFAAFIHTCHALFQGQHESALDHARECLKIGRDNGYDAWIADQMLLLLVPLADLYEQGEMRDYLSGIFNSLDTDTKNTLHQLESSGVPEIERACRIIIRACPPQPPPGLRIFLLGRFQLFRGDEEIPARQWSGKKARMLFKLLVHYRLRGYVNKEVFMEHLWPEEDPQKTAKRFHVTMGAVRKLLESNGHKGASSPYILSDGDNYQLSLGEGGGIDLEEFEDACIKAGDARDPEEAATHLFKAAALFHGDFLEEDVYEPWCARERERVRDLYLSVLASIVDYCESKKDYQKAVDYCGKYLAKDAYAEDLYQKLMKFHAMLGNKAMVKKTYEKCRRNIVDDLECPLSEETKLLARELISDDPPGS